MIKDIDFLLEESENFCILPWIHTYAGDSKFSLCKHNNQSMGKIYGKSKVSTLINSKKYKKIRNNMIEDLPVKGCANCPKRSKYNNLYKETCSELVEDTLFDGTLEDFQVVYWEQTEWDLFTEYMDAVKQVNFYKDDIIARAEHKELLQYWVESNLVEDVSLNYLSRLKEIDFEAIDYLAKIPNVNITVYASTDKTVISNIKKINKDAPGVSISIAPDCLENFPEQLETMYLAGAVDLLQPINLEFLSSCQHNGINRLSKDKYLQCWNKFNSVFTADEISNKIFLDTLKQLAEYTQSHDNRN